jgi:RimJ/RimL family protein N-acetyltransferase
MAESPPIETPRLIIAPFADRHLTARYVAWLSDPEITRFSEQRHGQHTLESCRAYWQSFQGTPNYFWAVMRRDLPDGHIGNLNAYVTPAHGLADVGVLIGERSAHGQGYATEAWLGVCDYLLRVLGLRKITAGTIEPNTAMLGVMRKTGMVEDGRRARQYLWDGQAVDVIHAALFRDAWLARFPNGPFAKGPA